MKQKQKNNPFKITMSRRNALIGWFFAAPFAIGTLLFFLYPVLTSFLLSFGDTDKNANGFAIVFEGLINYREAFFKDINFVPLLLASIKKTLLYTPLIVIFSLILAVLLNKLTFCKGFFRVVVLLPFLLGTGEVMIQLLQQGIDTKVIDIAGGGLIPREFLEYLGSDITAVIDTLFGIIVKVLWQCGVQTLLFLSAIQSISPALYESAKIDGADEYECFFKITLPMTSSMMLLNTIYTVISTFTDSSNEVLQYIQTKTLASKHGFASAMGWIYFIFILLLVGLIALLIGQYVRRNQAYDTRR